MVKTSEIKQEVPATVMERLKKALHKVGDVLDDLGNPNKHIDNPTGLKPYEQEGFAEQREKEVNSAINSYVSKGDKGIDY